jgi:hypothetical protein
MVYVLEESSENTLEKPYRIYLSNGCDVYIESSTFSEEFINYLFDPEADVSEIHHEAELIRSIGQVEVNRVTGIIFSFIESTLNTPKGFIPGIDFQLIFDRMLILLGQLCDPGEGIQGVGQDIYDRYIQMVEMIKEI